MQGTFRGVRFIKVVDELGLTPDEVQRLAYWLSYLNCRCQRCAYRAQPRMCVQCTSTRKGTCIAACPHAQRLLMLLAPFLRSSLVLCLQAR